VSINNSQTCDGCSACCNSIGCPPFLLELTNGVLHPVAGADSDADYNRLLAAPTEAKAAFMRNRGAINCACAWLDTVNNRCRFYNFRPDICRSFEAGGKWCLQFRELHQIG
jgi:Fe-S-cluster containining protein